MAGIFMDDPSSINRFIEAFRESSRRVFCSSFGESAGETVMFLLKESLGRDPFVALWENPRAVYEEMVRVFGGSAKFLIEVLITGINRRCGLNMDPKHFLEIMCSGSQSAIKELRSFIEMVAKASREEKT